MGHAFGVGICSSLCDTMFETHLFRTASLVLFFGAICHGEVSVSSRRDTFGRALKFEDMALSLDAVILLLCRSKTDQWARRFTLARWPGLHCGLSWLWRFF